MMPTKPQNTRESSVFPRATAITLERNSPKPDKKGTGELQLQKFVEKQTHVTLISSQIVFADLAPRAAYPRQACHLKPQRRAKPTMCRHRARNR